LYAGFVAISLTVGVSGFSIGAGCSAGVSTVGFGIFAALNFGVKPSFGTGVALCSADFSSSISSLSTCVGGAEALNLGVKPNFGAGMAASVGLSSAGVPVVGFGGDAALNFGVKPNLGAGVAISSLLFSSEISTGSGGAIAALNFGVKPNLGAGADCAIKLKGCQF